MRGTVRSVEPASFRTEGGLRRFLELTWTLCWSEVSFRYRRALLGFVWVLFEPVLVALVLGTVFSQIAEFRASFGRADYVLYLLAGYMPWSFLTRSVSGSMAVYLEKGHLLRQARFPRIILPLASVLGQLIPFVVSYAAVMGVLLAWTDGFAGAQLFVPISLGLYVTFVVGLCLICSTLNVFVPDVYPIVINALVAWFFATPIMYPDTLLEARYPWLLSLNPLYYLTSCLSAPLSVGRLPEFETWLPALASSLGMLLAGVLTYAALGRAISRRI